MLLSISTFETLHGFAQLHSPCQTRPAVAPQGRYPLRASLPLLHDRLYFRHHRLSIRFSASSNRSCTLQASRWSPAQPQIAKASPRRTTRAVLHSLQAPSFAPAFTLLLLFFASSSPSPLHTSKTSPASRTTDDLPGATHADTPPVSCNRIYAFPSLHLDNRHLLHTVTDRTTQLPPKWVVV